MGLKRFFKEFFLDMKSGEEMPQGFLLFLVVITVTAASAFVIGLGVGYLLFR